MSTVAHAALIVSLALLLLAAVACGVQMTQVKDAQAQRLARLYLEPLSTWCLAAVVVYALALVASGNSQALSLALPVGVGVAAALLRWSDEPHETAAATTSAASAGRRPATADAAATSPADAPAPLAAPVRPSTGSLWSRR
jgi:Mn2+/Fe2+ NRAMP family transporter